MMKPMPDLSLNAPNTPASRLATRLAFWISGLAASAWAPMVPFVKQRLQVDDRSLGLLLLCMGIGSVAAMVRTGPLCARYGCKPVVLMGGLVMAMLLPVLALAPSVLGMACALLLFGAALGSMDVAMNIHAVEVERGAGRPMMSGFHALFSVGGFCGAGLVTALLSQGLTPLFAAGVCSALIGMALLVTAPRLLKTATTATQASTPMRAWPRGPVVILSLLAAITFLVEGALLDWSALLMTDGGLSPPARAGWGYVLFSVAMTMGRFSGDAVTARWGDRTVVFFSGLAVVCGFVGLLTAQGFTFAMVGFVLIGLGASNIVPVLFRQAGQQNTLPAAMAISAVTTAGYTGYLLGPALIGAISQWADLKTAFAMLAALMVLVPLFAHRVKQASSLPQ